MKIVAIAILAVLALIYLIYEVWFEDRIPQQRWRKAISLCATLIIFPMLVSWLWWLLNADQRQEQDKFRKDMRDLVYDEHLSGDERTELITKKYAEFFATTKREAEDFANSLITSSDDPKYAIESRLTQNSEIIQKYELRWQPYVTMLFSEFDTIIAKLAESGYPVSVSAIKKFPLLEDTTRSNGESENVREVKFKNGHRILISYRPALVENGQVIHGGSLGVLLRNKTSSTPFIIFFKDKSLNISARDFRFNPFSYYTSNNPMEDAKLLDKTKGAIRLLISNVYGIDQASPVKQ